MKRILFTIGLMFIEKFVFAEGVAVTDWKSIQTIIDTLAIIGSVAILTGIPFYFWLKNKPVSNKTPSEIEVAKKLQKDIININNDFQLGVSGLEELTNNVILRIQELKIFRAKIRKYINSESSNAVVKKAKEYNKEIDVLIGKLKALLDELITSIENPEQNNYLVEQLITEIKNMNTDGRKAQKELNKFLAE